MVSAKNKRRLRNAAKRAKAAARKAGEAYWKQSGKVAERMKNDAKSEADEAAKEAEEVASNPEPNDAEDARLYRQVQQNHADVMAKLDDIEDELARPMDETTDAPSAEPAGEFDWSQEFKL